MVSSNDAIVIFSKSAELGSVKTRMRPVLNDLQCLSLHLALLKDTIARARTLNTDLFLFLAGSTPLPFDPGIPTFPQQGADLGERMKAAFTDILQTHSRAIVTGTDSPVFPPELFRKAFSGVETNDVVLGPAEDGGYYLIGLRKVIPEIFSGVDWGSPFVLQQTLVKLENRRVLLLESHSDADQPEDLIRLQRDVAQSDAAYLDHTRRWFLENYSAR